MTETERLHACVPALLTWYSRNSRALPWRSSPTPYGVWISEIMLQQTRIEAAIPHYLRFMERLPTVEDLANVPEEELMKLWEGLGYYSRARNLKRAAMELAARRDGRLPAEVEELRALPGIGDYTAGAIASIAFGRPEPAVDGNVLRVVLRLTLSREDSLDPRTRSAVAGRLRRVYPSGPDAGRLTEGLMELGETVCLPRERARCDACPLSGLCLAREKGRVAELPVRAPGRARRVEERAVLLLNCQDRYAIRRREDSGLLAGLWELPNVEGRPEPEELAGYLRTQGIEPLELTPCGEARHLFTHVEWRMRGFRVRCCSQAGPWLWVTSEALRRDYATPSAFRYFLDRIK